jgi:hypothetical protein
MNGTTVTPKVIFQCGTDGYAVNKLLSIVSAFDVTLILEQYI